MQSQNEFKMTIQTGVTGNYIRSVYLSCAWKRQDETVWVVVKELDSNNIRAVGDVPDLPEQNPDRIRRIMAGCSGFICMLQFRPDKPYTTSEFIIQELSLALELGLPIALLVEDGVKLEIIEQENGQKILSLPKLERCPLPINPLIIPTHDFYGPYPYKYIAAIAAEVTLKLSQQIQEFIINLKLKTHTCEPYAFVFSRLKHDDFTHAKEAIRSAVQEHAGIPCFWIDETERYTCNIHSERQRARELIRHAEFVVVDISRSAKEPYSENPTLAFELGQTDFAHFSTGHLFVSLKRIANYEPYYAVEDMPLKMWNDESELHRKLSEWIHTNRETLSRQVYNRSENLRLNNYTPQVVDFPKFEYDKGRSYQLEVLPTTDRIGIAIALGVSILSLAQLFDTIFNFSASYDLLSLSSSIIATFFVGFHDQILAALARKPIFRIALYVTASILFVIFVISLVSD